MIWLIVIYALLGSATAIWAIDHAKRRPIPSIKTREQVIVFAVSIGIAWPVIPAMMAVAFAMAAYEVLIKGE